MNTTDSTIRSVLNKPLSEITEEDIAQLTREDCRRFLKENGMRRPSWNKSQAIQQVISLKNLLESRPDSGDLRRKIIIDFDKIAKGKTSDEQTSDSPSQSSTYKRKDPVNPSFSGDERRGSPLTGRKMKSPEKFISPREDTNVPVNQLTIFYDGKVYVYNGVTTHKAEMVFQLASSSNCLSDNSFSNDKASHIKATSGTFSPLLFLPNEQSGKMNQCFFEAPEERKSSREVQTDGPTSRKASLQRYFEKKKDRDRLKGRRTFSIDSSSSTLDLQVSKKLEVLTN